MMGEKSFSLKVTSAPKTDKNSASNSLIIYLFRYYVIQSTRIQIINLLIIWCLIMEAMPMYHLIDILPLGIKGELK